MENGIMNFAKVVQTARSAFKSGVTRNLDFRIDQLNKLYMMCTENADALKSAVMEDLKKPEQEAILFEIEFTLNDIRCMKHNLKKWAKSQNCEKSFITTLDDLFIKPEPYGVVLVIGAWNYPLQLSLAPLVGAIAAGNCAILKPSEISPKTAEAMQKLVPKYLDSSCFHVVTGGPKETGELLKERFDYIFYTGSTAVGKIVRDAANEHLTPVTLELGGKSPVYIDTSVNMDIACKRLLWGKCINAGQTCVAPDYVLCTKVTREKLVPALERILKLYYGDDPQKSPDLGRIINEKHFNRVKELMKCGKIVIGGETDEKTRYIAPTVIVDVQPDDAIMQEEIFGPLLPIITVDGPDEAVDIINSKEKPLTLNIFSKKSDVVRKILDNTSSGSVCINDSIVNLSVDSLPFGGVGKSGMGQYHGKYSFDTFSHNKAVLVRNFSLLGEKLGEPRYPPYSDSKRKFMKSLMKKRAGLMFSHIDYVLFFSLGFASAFILKMILHFAGVNYF